ncbi:MAG: two-component system sensor histidine kinase NtrB [Thermoanaerobaculia bacterium]
MQSDARMLIAVRVVVVTTLLMASLIFQYTAAESGNELLPINYIYLITGMAYALTIAYIIAGQLIASREINLMLQFAGDLLVETALIYFTGGLDSPFSFLYLVSIITASMLLYRRGGLLTASGAVILYGALADVLYYEVIPVPLKAWFTPTSWTSSRLYFNMATNFVGFYATALLASYVSEKLQKTSEELTANRQNLAELRALNQNVVESIPSGVITLSSDGIASFVNPAGLVILQAVVREIIGCHVADLGFFSVDEWNQVRDQFTDGSVVRGERDLTFTNATRRVGFALTPLRTLDQEAAGYTLIFQDLTEMKKLEAEVRLKDRMAAVGELSAGIAHEIRNPLAAIAGSVQILRNSKSLSSQEQRLMSIVLKESERLNKSIAEFLRFVRPQERHPAEFDIAATLAETLELLSNSPELRTDHEIRPQIDPPSFSIVGDADQIRQVFWNLARNAVQAMQHGGQLTVRTFVGDGAYNIVFSDSGRGMSHSDLQGLFQPFRTSFPSGTGLGMAISYRIVQEHGGRIEVSSREGMGTAITVSLPLSSTEAVTGDQLPAISGFAR